MKKFTFVYRKPNNYYQRYLTFLLILSFLLALTYNKFYINIYNLNYFFLEVLLYFFLLIFITIIIEYLEKGEYISPIELYEVEKFSNELLDMIKKGDFAALMYVHKSNPSYHILEKYIKKRKKFVISSIIKSGKNYEINLIDVKKWIFFFIFKYLAFNSIHKVVLKKVKVKDNDSNEEKDISKINHKFLTYDYTFKIIYFK